MRYNDSIDGMRLNNQQAHFSQTSSISLESQKTDIRPTPEESTVDRMQSPDYRPMIRDLPMIFARVNGLRTPERAP